MKVDTLLNRVGARLGEDFSNSPIWTKEELLEYLRVVLKRFSALTRIVDRHSVRIVSSGTLSSTFGVPDDFNSAFHITYNQKAVDLVRLNDMDFVGDGWTNTSAATQPLAATQVGSGANTVISLTPSPSAAAGAFGSGVLEALYLESPDGTTWEITIDEGVLISTSGASGSTSTTYISGPTTTWELTINNDGVLSTVSGVGSTTTIFLEDSSNEYVWFIKTDDSGVLNPGNVTLGLTTNVQLDGTYQDFFAGDNSTDADYGIVVDAHATGVSTTPDATILADRPVGVVSFDRNMDNTATLYYIGSLAEPQNTGATLFIHDTFVPVLEHGVLAMAYGADNSGYDPDKAKILEAIFQAECTSIRETFGRR